MEINQWNLFWTPKEVQEYSDRNYAQLISDYLKRAESLKSEFLSLDIKAFRVDTANNRCDRLLDYYSEFCLFRDKQIIEKFKELGLNAYWLSWMMSIKDIEYEVNKIISDGKMCVLKHPLMELIVLHLRTKIIYEMCMWNQLVVTHEGEEITIVKKLFIDDYRKRDYGDGLPKTFACKCDYERHKMLTKHEKENGGRNSSRSHFLALSSRSYDRELKWCTGLNSGGRQYPGLVLFLHCPQK